MESAIIILGIIFFIFGAVFFSLLFGRSFRQWNEGNKFEKEKNKGNNLKTFLIGFTIFALICFILAKCGNF